MPFFYSPVWFFLSKIFLNLTKFTDKYNIIFNTKQTYYKKYIQFKFNEIVL